MRLHLSGLIAAAHTPLRADGGLAVDRVAPLVENLLGQDVDGLYVMGSTGEGPALRTEERQAAAEEFVTAADGRVPVIVQVGHQSMAEARALATHAAAIGADAISSVLLSYFPIRDPTAVLDTLEQIASAAPTTPFYYYSIPALSGVQVDVPELLADGVDRLPTLAGIKYTAPTVFEFQTCVDLLGDRLDMLFGCDEMLMAGSMVGAHGAVGSTYCFAAPIYRRLLAALEHRDLDAAQLEQGRSVAMIRTIQRHGGAPAIKATMKLCGFDCGPTRLPQRALDEAAHEALRDDLDRLGFFDWLDPDRAA